jgi:Zn-dependent M28 family amino/carboxypeptidase
LLLWAMLSMGCAASSAPFERTPAPAPAPRTTAPPVATREPPAKRDPLGAAALEAHVRALCSDAMAGRAAGTEGETRAFAYATAELEKLGLTVETHPFALRGGGASQNRYAFIGPAAPGGQLVVLGAHIDHLGTRRGEVHHGAEDNASGVAVALGIAESLAARRSELTRSVMVILFGAEELGMVGSRAFVRDEPALVKRSVLMINLDMIGRPVADQALLAIPKRLAGIDDHDSVGVLGTRDRPRLRALASEALNAADVRMVGLEDLPGVLAAIVERIADGRSDSFSFEDVGVPALFFSSGESDDYHRPSDTPERLDFALMSRRAHGIAELLVRVSRDGGTGEK